MNKQVKDNRIEDYHQNTPSIFTPQLKQGKFTAGNHLDSRGFLQKEKKDHTFYISKNQNQISEVRKFSKGKVGAQTKDGLKKQNSGQNFNLTKTEVMNEIKGLSQSYKQARNMINGFSQLFTKSEIRLDRITKVVESWENQEGQEVEKVRLSQNSEPNSGKFFWSFGEGNSSSGSVAGQESILPKGLFEQNSKHGDIASQNSKHDDIGMKKPNLSPPRQGGFPKSINNTKTIFSGNYGRTSPSNYNMKKTQRVILVKRSPGKKQYQVHYRNKSSLSSNGSVSKSSKRGGIGSGNNNPPSIKFTFNKDNNRSGRDANATTQSVNPPSNDLNNSRMSAASSHRREDNS